MDEKSECVDPYSTAKVLLPWPENDSWAHDYIWQLSFLPVSLHHLLLLKLSKTIGIKSLLRRVFQRARFIQESTTF